MNYVRDAERIGVNPLMLLPCITYVPRQEELQEHFRRVPAVAGLPIMLYSNPAAYRVDLGTLDELSDAQHRSHHNKRALSMAVHGHHQSLWRPFCGDGGAGQHRVGGADARRVGQLVGDRDTLSPGSARRRFHEVWRPGAPANSRKRARLEQHIDARGLPTAAPFERWVSARPTLPGHLPAIGRSQAIAALLYAFGHQHLELMLAAVTGEAVATLATGERPPADLAPFEPARFA